MLRRRELLKAAEHLLLVALGVQGVVEIRQHLVEVESRVLRAYRLLQENPATGDSQTALVADVRQLSDEYNKFVELNKTRPF